MSLRRQSVRDSFRGTLLQRRRNSRAFPEPTDVSPFSKDLTNIIGGNAVPAELGIKPGSQQTQSVIPFPMGPLSPQKLERRRASSAPSACPQTEIKRRLSKDTHAGSDAPVIGSTLNYETLSVHDFGGTMLHPKMVLESLKDETVSYHAWVAVKSVIDSGICDDAPKVTKAAMEQFLIELGKECIDRVPGVHITFTDVRLHNNSAAIIRQARRLITRFERAGVDRSKVILSVPATQDGVLAARELEKSSIQTNLILVSGLMHAAVCAEANTTTATVHVGASLDWFERATKFSRGLSEHPGTECIQSILEYFRIHKVQTKLIGSNFRSMTELSSLGCGFDAISLSEDQIAEWRANKPDSSSVPPLSPNACLRARQAQHPTSFLNSKKGFMTAMSGSTRSMITATLYVNLRRMAIAMNQLETIIAGEVERQLGLANLDMTTLYWHWRTQIRACPSPLLELAPQLYRDEPKPDWFLDSYGQDIQRMFALEDAEEKLTLERALRAGQQLEYQDDVRTDDLGNAHTSQRIDYDEDRVLRKGVDYY